MFSKVLTSIVPGTGSLGVSVAEQPFFWWLWDSVGLPILAALAAILRKLKKIITSIVYRTGSNIVFIIMIAIGRAVFVLLCCKNNYKSMKEKKMPTSINNKDSITQYSVLIRTVLNNTLH